MGTDEKLLYLKKFVVDKINNTFIEKSFDGNDYLIKNYNGNNILLYSSVYPKKQADCFAESVMKDNPKIVFLFGYGLGYELEKMIEMNSSGKYYIIEPDTEILSAAFINNNTEILLKNNIGFILSNDKDKINEFIRSNIERNRSFNIKFAVLPAYKIMFESTIKNISEYLKMLIESFRNNIYTGVKLYDRWYENYIKNLKYIKSTCPISNLKEKFNSIPAIIISAGPSLDNNIETLKKVGSKAFIATAGTGLSILEKNGIQAHMAFATDGIPYQEKIFEDLKVNKNIPFAYSNLQYYKVPSFFEKSRFIINSMAIDSFIYSNMKWDKIEEFSGPSVANNVAYNLAKLGFDPIIFLGQDLCFTGGALYAKGSDFKFQRNDEFFEKRGCIKTNNIKNEVVYTQQNFMAMKNIMEYIIKTNYKTEFLNGTENGLNINGARNIDFNKYFEDTLSKRNDIDINGKIERIYNNAARLNKNNYRVDNLYKGIKREVFELIQLCDSVLEVIKVQQNDDKLEIKINEANGILNKNIFYKNVLFNDIVEIEFLFSAKALRDRYENIFGYLLEKLLIMKKAFLEIEGEINA